MKSAKPNVVLILNDDMGYSDIRPYGHARQVKVGIHRKTTCGPFKERRNVSADAHGKPLAGALLIPSSLHARWAIMHRPSLGGGESREVGDEWTCG